MPLFLATLQKRNALLYWFGLLNGLGCLLCALLALVTTQQVLGVNAFVKPAKFFVSIWIFAWTMGWLTGLLSQPRAVRRYRWVVIITLTIELVIIVGQAVRGTLSHFNIRSLVDAALFQVMGIAITVMTLWTGYIGHLFWKRPPQDLSPAYLWGIRLGILFFVLFAFEGFAMAARLSHTVGAADGGPGLPVVNWSTRYGDLRIAHFFGMHTLQLFPLFGYYVARRRVQVLLFAGLYVGAVSFVLIMALAGKSL